MYSVSYLIIPGNLGFTTKVDYRHFAFMSAVMTTNALQITVTLLIFATCLNSASAQCSKGKTLLSRLCQLTIFCQALPYAITCLSPSQIAARRSTSSVKTAFHSLSSGRPLSTLPHCLQISAFSCIRLTIPQQSRWVQRKARTDSSKAHSHSPTQSKAEAVFACDWLAME